MFVLLLAYININIAFLVANMDQMNPERHVLVSVHSSELYQQLSQFLKTAFADHLTVEADKAFVIGYSGEFYVHEFKDSHTHILIYHF